MSVHVPIVLKPFDSFPFVFFVAPLRGDKILLVVRQYIFQSKLVKHDATPLCLSQAFINLVCKDTKDLSLDLIVAEKKKLQEELFARIAVGDVVEGTVKNVTDFGAFIDLGGADGLLHISEMSWGRVESPKKVFNVGDHVRVFIKDINDTKIALSMKFPAENPWNGAAEKYAVGNVVKGKVARMTDFGAFVELAPGVDALLHVSQIAKEHIEKPSDVLKVGQEIEAKIVDFNEDEKKISLSIKALLAPETNESEDADVADVDIDAVAAEEN